jgi:hypothetical protein
MRIHGSRGSLVAERKQEGDTDFAIGFIVLALISAGYFDETPTLIFAFFGALLLTYYFLNPGKSSSPPG